LENIRLESEIVFVDDIEVLKLKGEIDVYTAPDLKAVVAGMLAEDIDHLIIDMAQVSYMDSSAFGVLLGALKTVKPRGGTVCLACCSATIEKILGLTKLNTVFAVHKTVQEAAASTKKAS
jgi:anti-sigma B factor antagonist